MRIWRDLPSVDDLRAGGIKERAFLDAVNQYHLVQKDSLQNLFPRIGKLLEVIRVGKKSGVLSVPTGVKSIIKRATAKIEYLRLLNDYYTLQHPDEIANPGALAVKLAMEQEKADGGKLLGIAKHDRLEKLDPLHRSWEHDGFDSTVDTTKYVLNWKGDIADGYNEPFLIYLEKTDHCLDARMAKGVETVRYHNYRPEKKGEMPVWWLFKEDGRLRQWHPVTKTNTLFDTGWVTGKHTSKGGNFHALAYVWTAQKELVVDLHNPVKDEGRFRFHHSSFTGGQMIRCAGMIVGDQGKVTFIDGQSGHYRPPVESVKKLVKHLNKRDLFARNATVGEWNEKTKKDCTVAEFLAL